MTSPFDSLVTPPRQFLYHEKVASADFDDNYGRVWCGQIDQRTMHPTGALLPGPDWRAPNSMLVPNDKYFRFEKGKIGRFWIDVKAWIVDNEQAWANWERELGKIARAERGQGAQEAIDRGDPQLFAMAGATPIRTEFLRAMLAKQPDGFIGNRWVLGLPDPATGRLYPTPKWAVPMLGSLRRYETFEGSNVDLSVNSDMFADETLDEPDTDSDEIVQRLAAAERFENLDDEFGDEGDNPLSPAGTTGRKRGKFNAQRGGSDA